MIKFGTSDITSIFVGDKAVDKIYFGNDLKWQRTQPEQMLVYTGIDANGNYELDAGYDGTAVAYMLGDPYLYYNYNLISPTPTTKSEYSSKYVYDETEQKYVQCNYTSYGDTLTPSWVEVGVTPAYNRSNGTKDNYQQAEKDTNNNGFDNNMFNYKYFEGLSADAFSKTYSYEETIPVLVPAIGDLVLPDTYKGKPVTIIAGAAMNNYSNPNNRSGRIWGVTNRPTSITLGANITELSNNAFYYLTSWYNSSTFVLNNNVTKFGARSLDVYTNTTLTFSAPSTITFGANILGVAHTSTTIYFNTNVDFQGGQGSNSIVDNVQYAVFNTSITSVSGHISTTSGAKMVFMHGANDPITLSLSKAKVAITADIYTDNSTIQNYDWSGNANITPTFHPLSDYTGS